MSSKLSNNHELKRKVVDSKTVFYEVDVIKTPNFVRMALLVLLGLLTGVTVSSREVTREERSLANTFPFTGEGLVETPADSDGKRW